MNRVRNLYGEDESAGNIGKLYQLASIINNFQKKLTEVLGTSISYSEQDISETAFLSEAEEIKQNSYNEFISVSKKNIIKCAELVQRLKDIEDFDKRIIDFFYELVLKHLKQVISESEFLVLDHIEVICGNKFVGFN